MKAWLKWAILTGLVLLLVFLFLVHRQQVLAFISDPNEARAWLARLGPLGPLGLIAFNAAQVVLAPVPGYPVQIAAGYLFGWLRGSIYAAVGMVLGGIIAMSLGRFYGRPLVQRVVGADRLERWERVIHLESLGVWFVLMLGPLGDVPYYVAGLTRLPVWKIAIVALLVRSPSVVVAAAVGAGVISWRSPWFIAGAVILIFLAVLAARYQDRLDRWLDEQVLGRVLAWRSKLGPSVDSQESIRTSEEQVIAEAD